MSSKPNNSLLLISLLLSACIGGGGDSNNNVEPNGPTNAVPVIAGAPATTASEELAYADSTLSATDADGETVTWSLVGPAWLSIDATTGALSGTPQNSDVGTNNFIIIADDGVGGTGTLSLNINVAEVNDLPVQLATIPNHGDFDGFGTWDLDLATWMVDVDTSQTSPYTVELNTDSTTIGTAINGSILTLTQLSTNSSRVSLTVRLSDGGSAAFVEDTFDVVIHSHPYASSNWNDYVKNDGADKYTASGTACNGTETGGYSACIHAAEVFVFDTGLPGACATLTATDSMGAFSWVCDDSGPTTVYRSNGLADNKGLVDLIDFSGTPGWKSHGFSVSGGDGYVSRPRAWYSNAIVTDNDGMSSGAVAGTIYVVTTDPAASYVLDASRVALVVAQGVTMTGPVAGSGALLTANSQNFLWIEGEMDGTTSGTFNNGILLTSAKFSVVRLNSIFNANFGIRLDGSSDNLITQSSVDSSTNHGIELTNNANENTVSMSTVTNGSASGIHITGSSNNLLTNLSASFNAQSGVLIDTATNNSVTNLVATSNTSSGVHLTTGSSASTLSDIDVVGGSYGVQVSNSSSNSISNVHARSHTIAGVGLQFSHFNTLDSIFAHNCTNYGLYFGTSSDNVASNVRALRMSMGVSVSNSHRNRLRDITVSNGSTGSALGMSIGNGTDNSVEGLTAFNFNIGLQVGTGANNNVFSDLTLANNSTIGLSIQGNNNTFLRTASVNNYYGVYMAGASANTLYALASTDNTQGVYLVTATVNTEFAGPFIVGSNANSDCYVDAESTSSGGLKDDTGGVDATHDGVCLAVAPSSFGTATTGQTLATSFVGKVTLDDVINLHDTDGAASYPTDVLAFDWFGLESLYRGWGKDGTAFASLSNQGLWVSGTGRIWDWTLQLSDTLLKNVFAVPTGADTLTHTWSDASSTTFLQHALEISGDAIGNDDLLCETNETCLYTPNLSSYQGHSAIIPGPTFSNGTISGVTLKQYGVNGN